MKKSTKSLAALLGSGMLVGAAFGLAPAIEREGAVEHRDALREIETKPFAAELFAGLDNWTHAEPMDRSSIEGKVALLAVVAVNDPQSMLILSTLARYERQHGDDGLVALAVHPEQGWEAMNEKVAAGRVKVQVARDAGGAFVEGVHSDDYPDLYLIDRAGQLRFADIANGSLKSAVSQLLRETPEEAVINAEKQAQGIEVVVEEDADAGEVAPETREIPPAAYAKADWPAHNSNKLSAKDYQGKQLPAALGNEEWLTEEKPLAGKVLVLDFWATWCGPCRAASPKLEEIQREFEGKVEVLAIGGSSDDEGKHRKYVIANKKAYSNLYDRNSTINNAMEVRGIPHTVVISTDGTIRWQGNPLSSEFKNIVKQVIEADPMLQEEG
ncbi:MAG: TlpA family protein disulfide reductase [Phycisphaerales bacterium]